MTREQLIDYILISVNALAKCQCIETYHNMADKYDKEYTYTTFEVRGRKNWQFGVWILDSSDKKSYKVYLFGEHKWYIDKFKPSAAEISFEPFEISKRKRSLPIPRIDVNGYAAPHSVWEFGLAIAGIVRSSLFSRIKYYWGCFRDSTFDFVVGDWFYYAVKEPLGEWYKNYGMIVPLTISKLLYKLRFGRKVSVHIHSTREFFSPKWDFQVVYNTNDADKAYDIYHKINKKGKKLFLPKWLYSGYVNLVNAESEDDKHRGFYYKEEG